ncbi:MAG: RNA methyltransferase [Thermoanaerobaculia bacterium]
MVTETGVAPAVVLVRPQEDGNLGAVARAMANMGLERLVLVAPQADPAGAAARAMAVGARPLLEAAEVEASLAEALAPFARVVGTTSQRDRALVRPPLAVQELPGELASDPAGTPTALIFGPEASGLTADELALCSPLVTIPCAPALPTLNLAQAVLLVAYEIRRARLLGAEPAIERHGEDVDEEHQPAPQGEIEGLFRQVEPLLAVIGFDRDSTFHGVLRDLRALAGRGRPTVREIRILRGIARRAAHALDRPTPR